MIPNKTLSLSNPLKILQIPNPKLKWKAQVVEKVDDSIRKLMDDMLELMYISDGVGLAAPQVGISQRIVVLDYGDAHPQVMKMINPEIIRYSNEKKLMLESCLSVPEQHEKVLRSVEIEFKYLDEHNLMHQQKASGLLAHIIQHEVDHLDGILFIDHFSNLKKNILYQRATKAARFLKL